MIHTFDDRRCQLGEGPLWHPLRQQFFWFDILGHRLLSRVGSTAEEWAFDEHVSAAGWISEEELLIASESRLFRFNVDTGASQDVCPLEADNPVTRSNDGRADPQGGFWIGTMGKDSEPGAGAIYRYYKGELRKLYGDITVSNSICFAPDGKTAYFSNTPTHKIMKTGLDSEGWPSGEPEVFADLTAGELCPDGSVVDADGHLWCALWGSAQVARYAPDGTRVEAIGFPAEQMTCPSFGGDDLTTLYATSAGVGLEGPEQGQTFMVNGTVRGQAEHQVNL